MKKIFFIFALILILMEISFVLGATTKNAVFVDEQGRASYNSPYSSEEVRKYWPILGGDPEDCRVRQDVILQVTPAGCQPAVVRSDLIAEQDVAVFCQIDALKINPLIDIKQIRNIRFTGKYPEGVQSVGFHPAKAALRSRNTLLGSPFTSNVGYVVVVLKKQEVEKNLPDKINLTLSAQIEYESGNAFGIGRADFKLKEQSDSEWEKEKVKQSFWNGNYFVRLEEVDEKEARVALYKGERKVSSVGVERGKTSSDIYVPGGFCQAALQVSYDGFEVAKDKAIIEITNGITSEKIDVYEKSEFLNGKCRVINLKINSDGVSGELKIKCKGAEQILKIGELNKEGENSYRLYNNEEALEIYLIGKDLWVIKDGKENVKVGAVKNDKIELKFEEIDFDEIIASALKGIKRKKDSELKEATSGYNFKKNSGTITSSRFSVEDSINKKIKDALDAYEVVAEDFPSEKSSKGEIFGESALIEAIEFSKTNADADTARLIEKYLEKYPDGTKKDEYNNYLNKVLSFDLSKSSTNVFVDNDYWSVRLIDFSGVKDGKETFAEFIFTTNSGSGKEKIFFGEEKVIDSIGSLSAIKFEEVVGDDSIKIIAKCVKDDEKQKIDERILEEGENVNDICGNSRLELVNLEVNTFAKIRILPKAKGTKTETNISVAIGIEKRAIKLSPEKTLEMIENLNKSIEKWEKINNQIGKTVKGLQAACFATSAALTVKNILPGAGAKSIARKEVMDDWKTKCQDKISAGEIDKNNRVIKTFTQCVNEHSIEINNEIDARAGAINDVNSVIDGIEKKDGITTGSFLGGKNVDRKKATEKYLEYLRANGFEKELKDLTSENVDMKDLRELHYNSLAGKKGVNVAEKTEGILRSIKDKKESADNYLFAAKAGEAYGLKVASAGEQFKGRTAFGTIAPLKRDGTLNGKKIDGIDSSKIDDSDFAMIVSGRKKISSPTEVDKFDDADHLVVFDDANGKEVKEVYEIKNLNLVQDNNGTLTPIEVYSSAKYDKSNIGQFRSDYSINDFQDSGKFNNPINEEHLYVRYFESGVDKGFASIVPFDINEGWYAKVIGSNLVGNKLKAYDSSGLPKYWGICNVGTDGNVDSDDQCSEVFEGATTDINVLGLENEESRRLVSESRRALLDANRNRDNDRIKINGVELKRGSAVTPFDSVQCQDFHSPEECKLLFNVCDPVICPATRCNYGGQYPVADVVQSGIVGSALLCLPNIREGVYLPVCLTGINAGIDGYLSVLKSHRACLQESLITGRHIGICDQIYSIYLCDFFWRQVAPIAKIVLPTIAERAFGQGARGGGEYLTVMAAWNNAKESVNYFTQSYAVNSLQAFKVRSVEDVGSQVCKTFISARAPTSIKSLTEPNSPPQFHAWFSSVAYSDATVPATLQYKVFYHIFAGKNSGIQYRVYLKSGNVDSFYNIPSTLSVASNFVGRGYSATETRDFTAPEGYVELCVNIDGKEECGFGSVSTSVALDYLKDSYAKNQITQNDIKTREECVKGSADFSALLNNPNLQVGAEESILPDIQKKGITRICSSLNPGGAANPERFVEVGTCDENLICWLDTTSVGEAINSNNKFLLNKTLSEIEKIQVDALKSEGLVIDEEETMRMIVVYKKSLGMDRKEFGSSYLTRIKQVEQDFERAILNEHKAELLFIKAQFKKKFALLDLQEKVKKESLVLQKEAQEEIQEKIIEDYSIDNRGNFIFDKLQTLIYFEKSDSGETISVFYIGDNIGSVEENGNIVLNSNSVNAILKDKGLDENDKKALEFLQGIENINEISGGKRFLGDEEETIIISFISPQMISETGGNLFILDKEYNLSKEIKILYRETGRETGIVLYNGIFSIDGKNLNSVRFSQSDGTQHEFSIDQVEDNILITGDRAVLKYGFQVYPGTKNVAVVVEGQEDSSLGN